MPKKFNKCSGNQIYFGSVVDCRALFLTNASIIIITIFSITSCVLFLLLLHHLVEHPLTCLLPLLILSRAEDIERSRICLPFSQTKPHLAHPLDGGGVGLHHGHRSLKHRSRLPTGAEDTLLLLFLVKGLRQDRTDQAGDVSRPRD